jgi:SLOG cluster2
VAFVTPTGADREALAGRRIGISLSESTDLSRYGLGPLHIEDALAELVRHLSAREASLAFGGKK